MEPELHELLAPQVHARVPMHRRTRSASSGWLVLRRPFRYSTQLRLYTILTVPLKLSFICSGHGHHFRLCLFSAMAWMPFA